MTTVVNAGVLNAAQIAELLGSSGKTRSYKPTIIKFAGSGELYVDFMEIPDFANKKVDAVYASATNNLKMLCLENPTWPELQLLKVSGDGTEANPAKVLLINKTALADTPNDDVK